MPKIKKMRWFKVGDVNTSFFHGWLNKRRRGNEILCLQVEDRLVVEVGEIRGAIREHFRSHFLLMEELILNYLS